MERIDQLFTARPEMGVRRMYHELTTPDNPINIKRTVRRCGTSVNALNGARGCWAKTQPVQAPTGPYDLSLLTKRAGSGSP